MYLVSMGLTILVKVFVNINSCDDNCVIIIVDSSLPQVINITINNYIAQEESVITCEPF